MAYPTKIATCCHCGSKATLRLDQARHELSCASCGAPLHDLKMIPVKAPERPGVSHQRSSLLATPVARKPSKPDAGKASKKSKPLKRRKRWFSSRLKDMAEDLLDVVEDIFD